MGINKGEQVSRGQLARTPENFPRMKHRAAGRIAKREAMKAAPEIFQAFERLGREVGKAFQIMSNQMAAWSVEVGRAVAAERARGGDE